MHYGNRAIDNVLTFTVNTHATATGAATDATGSPAYRVYEDENTAAILTGTMSKLDDANTLGLYSEQLTLSAANGFEVGKSYSIYVSATVSAVAVTMSHAFQVVATLADANVVQLNGDAAAAVNLELQYDGTGLIGSNFPAKQSQLDSLTSVGAAINTTAATYVLTTGTQSSGTFADTAALDSTHHEHTDVGAAIELYYEFSVGGDGVPVSTKLTGQLSGGSGDIGVYAFDWDAAAFTQIGVLVKNGGDSVNSYDLFTAHVGTGANIGLVRVRLFAASGLSGATLSIDQLLVSFAVVNRSVGYDQGAVHIDTSGSNTGTELQVDGTADNPVSTIAAATTIATALGVRRFRLIAGSSITLVQTYVNFEFIGAGYNIDLNGQVLTGCQFFNALSITGTATTASTLMVFSFCRFTGTCTLGLSEFRNCRFAGTLVMTDAGPYISTAGTSGLSNGSFPVFDFGTAANTDLVCRGWSGPIQVEKMGDTGTDTLSLEGFGKLVEGTCTGGTVFIRGILEKVAITNLTLEEDARLDHASIQADADAALVANHLDHLLAVTYNPASKPGAADSLWNQLLEDGGGGVQRYTTAALSQSALGNNLTQQEVADAARLAPAGTVEAGSIDEQTTAIKAKTDNLPESIKKNTALNNFLFLMVDGTDHVTPKTGLTVAGTRALDGSAFAAITGTISEISNGIYSVDLTAADTNGDFIGYRFAAAGADDTFIGVKTTP